MEEGGKEAVLKAFRQEQERAPVFIAADGTLVQREGYEEILYGIPMQNYFREEIYQEKEGAYDPYGQDWYIQQEQWLDEVYGDIGLQKVIKGMAGSQVIHEALGALGVVLPVADGVDGVLYAIAGDKTNAAISLVSILPVADVFTKTGKNGARILNQVLQKGGSQALQEGGQKLIQGLKPDKVVETLKLVYESADEKTVEQLSTYLDQIIENMQNMFVGGTPRVAFAGDGIFTADSKIVPWVREKSENVLKATGRLTGGGSGGKKGVSEKLSKGLEETVESNVNRAAKTELPKDPEPGIGAGREIDPEDGIVLDKNSGGAGSSEGGTSAKGLIGHDFEDYLSKTIGGDGSFSVEGRDFDGGVGSRWWEAKSGNYWRMLEENPNALAKFKSDMGDRLRIATENGATYELFSNTPIPESIKQWLTKKGIPFTELLD